MGNKTNLAKAIASLLIATAFHLIVGLPAAASEGGTITDLGWFDAYKYQYGEKPPEHCVKRVLEAAKRADATPHIRSSAAYAIRGLSKEKLDLLELLEKPAGDGDARCKAALGAELVAGVRVARDVPRGLALLQSAAKDGEPSADHELGLIFLLGVKDQIPRDIDKAEKHFNSASENGMTRALGGLLQVAFARGNRPEYIKAAMLAANEGDTDAMMLLFRLYKYEPELLDPGRSTYWAGRGAICGDRRLMVLYAIALDEGFGTQKDPALAQKMLQRAVVLGDIDAIVLLEYGRAKGRFGVRKDNAAGIKVLTELANEKLSEAQFMLGRMLIEGDGIDADKERGIALVREASQGGSSSAKSYLEKMLKSTSSDTKKP